MRWNFSNSANVFSQSITRTWTHHRGTTGTEKSPRQGHCVWVTQRNQVLRVSESSASVALMALKLGVYKSIQFLILSGLFCTPQHHLHPIIASGQTTKKPPMTTIMRSSRRWIEDIEEQFLFSEDDIKFSVLFCKKKNCSWLPVVNENIKFQYVRREMLNSVATTSLSFWLSKTNAIKMQFKNFRCLPIQNVFLQLKIIANCNSSCSFPCTS